MKSAVVLLACACVGLAAAARAPPGPGRDEPAPQVGGAADIVRLQEVLGAVQSRSLSSDVRACFDEISTKSLQAASVAQNDFNELLDKVEDGNKLVDSCDTPNDLSFAMCFAPPAEGVRDAAEAALQRLQASLQQGSGAISAAVSDGVDCVISKLMSVAP